MAHAAWRLPATLTALLLLAPATAGAWVVSPDLGYAVDIAQTADGTVVSAGRIDAPVGSVFSVRALSAVDGAEVWDYELTGTAPQSTDAFDNAASTVAIDGDGNVVAAGTTRNTGTGVDVQVVKLAPGGSPLWTRAIDSPNHGDEAFSTMALGPGGDVVVTGVFGIDASAFGVYTFTVVRLSGATGVPVWSHDVPGLTWSRGITVDFDAAGDVLAWGDLNLSTGSPAGVALKLDGTTGDELWRTIVHGPSPLPEFDSATVAAVDATGDFYVSGHATTTTGGAFTVCKLSGTTGGMLWRFEQNPPGRNIGYAQVLGLDGAGHVYAAADVDGRLILEKLTTDTGTEVWRKKLLPRSYFSSLAFDPEGNPILGGTLNASLALQKLRALDGKSRWRRRIRGNKYNSGHVAGMTVDASGAVFAAGAYVSPPKGNVTAPIRYTIVKACGSNGRLTETEDCP